MGLMPGSGTVAGAYHICLHIAVPGAINTPQYQEITLTAVNDSITGVIPATTTLTDDAIDYGGLIQMQCLSAVSPQCATSKWTMASNANFTMAENGSITPVGHPADGTYNLSVSVGGAGPFTVTVNIVPHTNWNGGSLNRILTGFPAAPPNESPLLHVQTGRVPDFTAGFTSITGPQPCNNNLPLASATTCGPGGGWIPGGAGKAQGYPTVVNYGVIRTDRNWQPVDFGGGAHSWECGAGYHNFYREATLNTSGFIQSTLNQLQASFRPLANQTYFLRLNWEGIVITVHPLSEHDRLVGPMRIPSYEVHLPLRWCRLVLP